MTFADSVVIRLGVAALIGIAVGLEREWSGHASGPHPRFAGIRTFMLLGGLGGLAGWFAESDLLAIALALLLGASALVVVAYFSAARSGGATVEGTTEVAALLVLALGVLTGLGELGIAGGSTAVVLLALSEKARVHRAIERLDEPGVRAAVQFAVLALVVLPVLPNESYGPLGGIQPRTLWMVVLLFSGLNFASYLARKAVGGRWGDSVAGMLGGTVSSTLVTWSYSRLSRQHAARAHGLAIGVVGACTVLMVRVELVSLTLNPPVALALVRYALAPFLVGAAYVALFVWRNPERGARAKHETEERNPLGLWPAIKMAVMFQFVLMGVVWVRENFDNAGVEAAAVLLGLTDMDALTLSMNRMGSTAELVPVAARAIGIGVLTNTMFKLVVSAVTGSTPFRKLALPGLALLGIAGGVSLWLWR